MVLDCRYINPHLFKFKFKYEDAEVARDIFQTGDYVFSYDLKSAYHHIDIFPDHREYLGFSWVVDGQVKYYNYNVLPFGISTAGFIFTKVTRHFVKHIRSKGHKLIMYLDDGLAGSSDLSEARKVSELVKSELDKFGFLLADEKCDWNPSRYVSWLGFDWDFHEGVLRVTNDRESRILGCLSDLLKNVGEGQVLFNSKFVASIIGQIISTKAVIGDLTRRNTRFLYFCLEGRASWKAKVKLSTDAIKEAKFWHDNFHVMNKSGVSIKSVDLSDICSVDMYSDASDTGYGGYLRYSEQGDNSNPQTDTSVTVQHGQQPVLHGDQAGVSGVWSHSESQKSSTWRELESVNRILKCNTEVLEGKKVCVVSDNKNVSHILKVGSKKSELQDICKEVHNTCHEKQN